MQLIREIIALTAKDDNLFEGGAATEQYGTSRSTQSDIKAALKFVNKVTNIPLQELEDSLLGSTPHTLMGKKADSGDIDIAIQEGLYNEKDLVEKMRIACNMDKVKNTGGKTYSFAVPTNGDKRVQVDFMFVPSKEWAKFGFHSDHESQYKGAIRNALIDSLLKQVFKEGDLLHKEDGTTVIRVRRSFMRDKGLMRLYKMAPMRKDGKGRTQLKTVKPEEIEAELARLGIKKRFSKDADPILDPKKAAEFLFAEGVKPDQLSSAEKLVKLISKYHADKKDEIFKDAAEDVISKGFTEEQMPKELRKFVS
jgi:hypothetical protein